MVGVDDNIPALTPNESGHQFVFYGDACSGVPGASHEATFAATNNVVRRLDPQPEFVIFAGDEIVGLTTNEDELRRQWRYWLDVEMGWLDRTATPLYNTTSNHTTYDEMSERVFVDVLGHPTNHGAAGQQGLSYVIRRDDLLLVFVNTCWSGLGGEGRVETDWLAETLADHRNGDTRHKFVIGHHPAFAVNGFSGPYQRELAPDNAEAFWNVLVDSDVTAYLCSHILAFDVQVHRGVLQIVSAGAGTAHRMPAETEYLHAVQMAVDDDGLRYQVIDQAGTVRERLAWPDHHSDSNHHSNHDSHHDFQLMVWRLVGTASNRTDDGRRQTLLALPVQADALPPLWIGLTGTDQRLTAIVAPEPGRSPHYWFGPSLEPGTDFDLNLGLHTGMGPGGIMWRSKAQGAWSSLTSSSPWGLERIKPHLAARPADDWLVGTDFRGDNLRVCHIEQPDQY